MNAALATPALTTILDKATPSTAYGAIMEEIFAADKQILAPSLMPQIVNLSSGASTYPAFRPFLQAVANDMLQRSYYTEYTPPAGSPGIRQALAIAENARLEDSVIYNAEDFCLTEGATAAIHSVIRYIAHTFPTAEVLIPTPAYYIFAMAAKYTGLATREINMMNGNSLSTNILEYITDNTRLICITQPDNPTGTVYSPEDLERLLDIARKKNIFVLFDEVFFDLIFPDTPPIQSSDLIAFHTQALEQIIVVRSFSKDKNLPGLRIGYAFSKNKDLIAYVTWTQESTVCFAAGSNYHTLMQLEASLRTIDHLVHRFHRTSINPKDTHSDSDSTAALERALSETTAQFNSIKSLEPIALADLRDLYVHYIAHRQHTLAAYRANYDLTTNLLQLDPSTAASHTRAAFNTFVDLKVPAGTNHFDYTLNLFLSTGIKIQLGPYFGYDQKRWEDDPQLGSWARITFALQPDVLKDALHRLIAFHQRYCSNPASYLQTNLRF